MQAHFKAPLGLTPWRLPARVFAHLGASLLSIAALSGDGRADAHAELFAFHREVIAQSINHPDEDALSRSCRQKIEPIPWMGLRHLTFAGAEGTRAILAVYTDRKVRKVGGDAVWLEWRMTTGPRTGREASPDWAYIFDRNSDGRVDWLAFLVGPMPVVPDGHDGQLPELGDPTSNITTRELLFVLEHERYVFWEIIDRNFDGAPDTAIVPARRADGWYEGVMLLEDIAPGGRPGQCCWHSEHGPDTERRCTPTAQGCETADHALQAISERFPPGTVPRLFDLMGSINAGVKACGFGPGDIPPRPRRY